MHVQNLMNSLWDIRIFLGLVPKESTCTWVGQNNGKSCERYQFLYYYWVGSLFSCNTACILLEIDLGKFWIVSSGVLYYSSCKNSSSCWRDDEGGNSLLIILSKTVHSCWKIFKSGDCTGQGRCSSASTCAWNQDWTILMVCIGGVILKIALLLRNFWTIGYIRLPNMST